MDNHNQIRAHHPRFHLKLVQLQQEINAVPVFINSLISINEQLSTLPSEPPRKKSFLSRFGLQHYSNENKTPKMRELIREQQHYFKEIRQQIESIKKYLEDLSIEHLLTKISSTSLSFLLRQFEDAIQQIPKIIPESAEAVDMETKNQFLRIQREVDSLSEQLKRFC